MMHESECCARGAQWSSLLGRVVASCACLPAPMPAPMPDCPAAPLPACRAAECGVGGGRRPGARHLPRGQAAHRAPHRQRHTAGVWVGGSGVAGWVRLCVTWAGAREEGVEGDSSPRSAPPASPASQPSPGASTSPAGRGVRPGRARRLGGGLPRRQLGGSHHPERGHHRHGVLPGGDLRPRAGLPGGGPDVCVCGVCVRLVCGCGVRGSSGIRDRQQGAAWCVALCPQHPPIPPITRTCAAAPPPPTPHTLPLRPHACCHPPPSHPSPPPAQADSLEEAISIINANEHGNGTALFTASGAAARRFQQDVDVGMVRGWGAAAHTCTRMCVNAWGGLGGGGCNAVAAARQGHWLAAQCAAASCGSHPSPAWLPGPRGGPLGAGGHQHPHPRAPPLLQLHGCGAGATLCMPLAGGGCLPGLSCRRPVVRPAASQGKRLGATCPVSLPVPPAGWRGSFYGDLQMYGRMGVQFYTRVKTVTQSWKDSDAPGVIPGLAGVGASTPGKH